MIQQHPYCRTCGSMVQSKNVCHYCGCEPLKGHHYCCDCGTSTIAEAIMCVHCGASFQRKFPVTLAVLISLAVVVTMAGVGYFITQETTEPTQKIAKTLNTENKEDSVRLEHTMPGEKNESGKIIINNPSNLFDNKNAAITKLTKSLPSIPKLKVEEPIIPEKVKEKPVINTEERVPAVTGRTSTNAFSSRETRSYGATCTYFTGRSKNNVVFFTTNVYGYVKINGKVYTLQGVQKGNDIARFSGAGYEVTIEIEGLAGSEEEWLAEATMVVKDVRQRSFTKHKIFSTCTDF